MNVRYKKNRKQAAFRRIMVSWVIILLVGMLMGFFIGRSTKKADTMPMTTESSIPSPTITHAPYVRTAHVPVTSEPQPKTELVSLGEFRITAYCHCEKCCGDWSKDRPTDEDGKLLVYTASGELAVEGVTIAADTSVLPFGTEVIIDGNRYIVQDRGRVIKNNRIDVYFENHQDALEFGVQYKEVFIERMVEND
jgi:3D (Asp-Asp-Asp) domain-containing protein